VDDRHWGARGNQSERKGRNRAGRPRRDPRLMPAWRRGHAERVERGGTRDPAPRRGSTRRVRPGRRRRASRGIEPPRARAPGASSVPRGPRRGCERRWVELPPRWPRSQEGAGWQSVALRHDGQTQRGATSAGRRSAPPTCSRLGNSPTARSTRSGAAAPSRPLRATDGSSRLVRARDRRLLPVGR
jgi:hypothetical protein